MSIFDGRLQIEVAVSSGIEAVVKRELISLGYLPGGADRGRITFEGDFKDAFRANMFLRAANRVRVVLCRFDADSFDALFDELCAYDWQFVMPLGAKVIVDAKSHASKLLALSAIQSVSKKAIVSKLCEKYGVESLEESGETYRVEISLDGDVATVTLDLSGEGLHKRGYRVYLGEAPIRETLASAMIQLSVWNPDRPLIDPFCGSGTIPIEAAMIGLNIASGSMREFACESFKFAPKIFDEVRQEARDLERRDRQLKISGFDIDPAAIRLARKHALRAGVADAIHLQVGDMRDVSSNRKYGVIITNPPYGERLMSEGELKDLYRDFGKMTSRLDSWSVYAITSYKGFEKYFGKTADKTRKLYNSELECRLYRFLSAPPPKRVKAEDHDKSDI